MFATTVLYTFALFLFHHTNAHGTTGHPIGKLIQGTFAEYDADTGALTKSLYVCKASGGRYYWTIYQVDAITADTYLAGTGNFHKSDIDYSQDIIGGENGQCFYQTNGKARQVTPCSFDVGLLCDHKQITLSFLFNSESVSLDFTKISTKDELIGNDHVSPYQCGIPWDGDIATEDTLPYAFASDVLPWSPEGWREADVFDTRDSGCWAYVFVDDSHANANYGTKFDRKYYWSEALLLQKWTDLTLPEEDECDKGSEMLIRVDQETMLIGWNCEGTQFGSGYLMYRTTAWNTCPIPRS